MKYYELACSFKELELRQIPLNKLVWGEMEVKVADGEQKSQRVPLVRIADEVFASGEYLLQPPI
jgi:hypothetical protein